MFYKNNNRIQNHKNNCNINSSSNIIGNFKKENNTKDNKQTKTATKKHITISVIWEIRKIPIENICIITIIEKMIRIAGKIGMRVHLTITIRTRDKIRTTITI